MAIVNNVTRLLDQRHIPYEVFELPAEKLGARETAGLLGIDPAIVFKTIVVTRDKPGKPLLVVVPGDSVVDLKQVAAAVGDKKVYLPTEREAETMTGLQAGGISPLALLNKGFHVLIDAAAQAHTHIHVSGGQRGLNVKVPLAELIKLTNAKLARVSRPEPEA
jgi:Cys-tRNA(Pro)/Cys-tRNA(Cys) deacylase